MNAMYVFKYEGNVDDLVNKFHKFPDLVEEFNKFLKDCEEEIKERFDSLVREIGYKGMNNAENYDLFSNNLVIDLIILIFKNAGRDFFDNNEDFHVRDAMKKIINDETELLDYINGKGAVNTFKNTFHIKVDLDNE